jgi:hypothetical protein
MNCAEFLARYSEFRDGTVTAPRELRRFRRHVAVCARCRAFDTAVRNGVAALRDVTPVTPSASFRRKLDERLAAERAGSAPPRAPVLVRVAGGLLVLAAMSLVAWEAGRRTAPGAEPSLPPVVFCRCERRRPQVTLRTPTAYSGPAYLAPPSFNWRCRDLRLSRPHARR